MRSITLLSPAKVNLSLHVTGKRPDGYHTLRMVMTRISLFDEVTLTLQPSGITVSCDDGTVPTGEENIAWRAAARLAAAKELQTGVHIDIRKRIPMGGGLGGGSSNAAAVLMGLNDLTGGKASRRDLMEIGLTLGADVPFFIFEGPALAQGIGEKLSPIEDLPPLHLILINPGVHVPTSEVFRRFTFGLTKKEEKLTMVGFDRRLSKVCSNLHNDLEDVTFGLYPAVKEAKEFLLARGARGALMSGSGATVFGLYRDGSEAETRHGEMARDIVSRGWVSFAAHSL